MKMTPKKRGARGFSLLELLIAMVVLAIGIMATMAMQFIALAGYSVSRDNTGASEVARAVEQRLKAEALSWSPSLGDMAGVKRAYQHPGFVTNSLLLTMNAPAARWAWQPVFVQPVDQSLTTNGMQRFCAFVSGGPLLVNNLPREAFRVQIAVVYPAARGTLGACSTIPVADLDPSNPNALEVRGLRASYFGTVVQAGGF